MDFLGQLVSRKLPEGTEQWIVLLVGGSNGLCDTIRLREAGPSSRCWVSNQLGGLEPKRVVHVHLEEDVIDRDRKKESD